MSDPFHVVTCFFAFHLIIDAFVYVFSRVDIAYHVYRNTSKNTQNWNCWHTQAGHLGCTLSSEMWCMSGFSLHKQQSIPTIERGGKKNNCGVIWVICQVRILLTVFGSVVHFVNAVMPEMWPCRFHIRRCFQVDVEEFVTRPKRDQSSITPPENIELSMDNCT